MTNHTPALRQRIEALQRTGRSAGEIAKILAQEGVTDGASRASVGRLLREIRGPVRSPRVTQAAQPSVSQRVVSAAPREQSAEGRIDRPSLYVPDDEAIDAHVEAIAEFIDRRVDESVDAELADAESLKDRWQNRAALAGWQVCSSCGLRTPPRGTP